MLTEIVLGLLIANPAMADLYFGGSAPTAPV